MFKPRPRHTKDEKKGTSVSLAWRSVLKGKKLASLLSYPRGDGYHQE